MEIMQASIYYSILQGMNWLDYVALIFILLCAFKGFKNGLILQLFSLAGLLLAWILAEKCHLYLLPWLSKIDIHGNWATGIAYVVCFLTVLLLAVAIGKLLTHVFDFTPLGVLNRLAGILLGVAEGLLLLVLLYLCIVKLQEFIPPLKAQALHQSVVFKFLNDTFHFKDYLSL